MEVSALRPKSFRIEKFCPEPLADLGLKALTSVNNYAVIFYSSPLIFGMVLENGLLHKVTASFLLNWL